MPLIELNEDWTALMRDYEADHQDPRNRACPTVGIPLLAASIPGRATVVALPIAAPLFTGGRAVPHDAFRDGGRRHCR